MYGRYATLSYACVKHITSSDTCVTLYQIKIMLLLAFPIDVCKITLACDKVATTWFTDIHIPLVRPVVHMTTGW